MNVSTSMLSVAIDDDIPPKVKVCGEADYHNRRQIYDAVRALIDDGHETVRADLSELHYMDSSALATLLKCAAEVNAAGGVMELTGASRQVSKVLTQCGAAAFFRSKVQDVPIDSARHKQGAWTNLWRVSEFSLPANPEAAAIARQRVADLVNTLPLNMSDSADVIIAFGEAVANAVRHGCQCNPNHTINVKCVAGPGRLAIDVSDSGSGFSPDEIRSPSPKSIVDGGMGIYIMRELMDEVDFFFDDGTTARLVKYISVENS